MSEGIQRYLAWLDFAGHDRPPGYYGLLKLATFEPNLDRISQALFQESLDVSNFLRGPQREVAEAVLEEINRAESCLTNPASKADYDASLRASNGDAVVALVTRNDHPAIEEEEEARSAALAPAPALKEHRPVDDEPAPRPRPAAAKPSAQNSAATAADRSVLAAIEQARRRTSDDVRKKPRPPAPQPAAMPAANSGEAVAAEQPTAPATQTISLTSAIGQSLVASIPAPLVKYRKHVAVAAVLTVGLGFAVQFTTSAFDKPRPPRVRIDLKPDEELMFSQQMSVLYNLGNDTATRAAAAEKLRSASPDAIRRFSYNLGDLAGRQPEPEIQETLRSLLASAGSGS